MNKIYVYNSSAYAKERLLGILASDRIGCSPDFLEDMKSAIKNEIDKYAVVCESDIDIQIKEKVLVARIPLNSTKINNTFEYNIYTHTGRGSEKYESMEEESAELKSIQS